MIPQPASAAMTRKNRILAMIPLRWTLRLKNSRAPTLPQRDLKALVFTWDHWANAALAQLSKAVSARNTHREQLRRPAADADFPRSSARV
jgi:hypothetical protein